MAASLQIQRIPYTGHLTTGWAAAQTQISRKVPGDPRKGDKKCPKMPEIRHLSEKKLDRKIGWDILRRQNNARRVP
jgi:hypothetical protein